MAPTVAPLPRLAGVVLVIAGLVSALLVGVAASAQIVSTADAFVLTTGSAPFDSTDLVGTDSTAENQIAVSYTHLTLPTTSRV